MSEYYESIMEEIQKMSNLIREMLNSSFEGDLILIGEKWANVPLKGENGVILKEGKKFLINTNNYGLRAIMDAYDTVEIDDEFICKITDVITPTINVVTMMDNARIIIELLITNKKERAQQITKYLNKSRENI